MMTSLGFSCKLQIYYCNVNFYVFFTIMMSLMGKLHAVIALVFRFMDIAEHRFVEKNMDLVCNWYLSFIKTTLA